VFWYVVPRKIWQPCWQREQETVEKVDLKSTKKFQICATKVSADQDCLAARPFTVARLSSGGKIKPS
jgi:hypothetical protein